MKPIVEMTEAIGGEKWASISSVQPLIYKITNKYLPYSEDDSPLVKQEMITNIMEMAVIWKY